MHRSIAGLTAVLLLASAEIAAAQNPGLPVVNSGVSTGLTLAADVGFPSNDAGGGTAFGGTGKVGFGPIGVTATISSWKPDGEERYTSFGGTGNLKIFGGPLVPFAVTLQAGAGYTKDGTTTLWHIPVGLGLSIKIPTTVIGLKPWVAPRLDISRVSTPTGSNTDKHFGLSAGVELNLLSGLGLQVAYDRVSLDNSNPTVFSVGIHYGLSVPGLP
ncbi:MAG TPA: outer membrane beta-barrel protein [Gemmatimonadales bacterium]|jgi:hypothetical protein|nr:outer membrane beta-barrel protein [Gemmatimonadales bacterium]